MRTLRAIYNHVRKTNKSLPADNPANRIDWNREMRRDTGMGIDDLRSVVHRTGGSREPG